jgi:hypothetical protein
MGLLFQMPVEKNELDDRAIIKEDEIILRSYGLPMVFWGYLAALLAVIFFMILAIKGPLMAVLTGEDRLNQVIGLAVLALLVLGPLGLLGFYFYEKEIHKKKNLLTVTHKVFFVPIKKTTLDMTQAQLELEHFLDSPNMAAMKKEHGMAGFENRGYFKLVAKGAQGKSVLVDRNSRRGEMRKLKELLESIS